jgi:Protein of unknown function (DUF3987)/RepB DNA-primase N-terminal domain
MESRTDQVERFVACVYASDDVVEIRRLPSGKSSWHRADELVTVVDALADDNGRGQNIHPSVNPRITRGTGVNRAKCSPESRCGRCADCVGPCRVLVADFDKTTVEFVRGTLSRTQLPDPTMLLNSGHGVHAYWRLAEPIPPTEWTSLQRDLAALLGSDPSVHDAPRVMRLPGFVNHKLPVADCTIVEADPTRIYDIADLRERIPRVGQVPMATDPPRTGSESGVVKRARMYLSKTPGAVEGTNGDDQTFKVCCTIINDFGLSKAKAWPLLCEWNTRCKPTWPEADLRKKLENAAKYSTGTPGSKASQALPSGRTKSTANGSPIKGEAKAEPIPQYQSFPTDTLPEPIRSYVELGAKAIYCDAAFLALPALAMCASAIGTTRRIRLKSTWTEPAVLWCCILGRSGSIKSPAQDLALQPLSKRQEVAIGQYRDELKEFEASIDAYDAVMKQWKAKGQSSGKTRPEKPTPPTADRSICSDTTIEALSVLLEENPRGLLLARDELSGWLGSFDAYKSAKGCDAATWLQFHRAGDLIVDRKSGSNKLIFVPNAAVSICGTIQPSTFQKAIGAEHFNNGLAARLLLAKPPLRRKWWSDAEIDYHTRRDVDDVIEQLLELEHHYDPNDNRQAIDIPLTADGQARWNKFFNDFAGVQVEESDDNMAAWLSKLEGYTGRFALIFHFIRWANRDPSLSDPNKIDLGSLESAIRLTEWFVFETRRIYSSLHASDETIECQRLVDWIANNGRVVTARDLQRGCRARYPTADDARAAIDGLVEAGFGCWETESPPTGGGRQKRRFILSDTTTSDTRPVFDSASGSSVTCHRVTAPNSTIDTPEFEEGEL